VGLGVVVGTVSVDGLVGGCFLVGEFLLGEFLEFDLSLVDKLTR
jgi:hypothetical protein